MNDLHNTLSISGLARGVYSVVITVYTRYVRVCMYVCMYVRKYVRMYICMYVCTYICMHVCMYVL
jgi:hypothetical protein